MTNIFSRLARPYPLPSADASNPTEWNRPLASLFDCLTGCEAPLDSYRRAHTFPLLGDGPLQETALAQLAVVRLQVLLEQGRKELAGLFNTWEMSALLTSYMSEFVTPDDSNNLASVVARNLGIGGNEAEATNNAAFISKLLALSLLQRTALFDALEVMYHSRQEPLDVLKRLQIQLR